MLHLHRTGRGTGILAAALAFAALPSAFAQTAQPAITLNKPVAAEALAGPAIAAPVSTAMRLAPDYRAFQQAKVGETSAPEVFSFTFNVATQVTGITGTPDFKVTGGSCSEGHHYLAGDTCTVEVAFTPQGPGHRTGKLAIAHTASARPFVVPSGGEAIGAAMSFIPAAIETLASEQTGKFPEALTVDGGDNLYVIDSDKDEVRTIDSTGKSWLLAGGGSVAGEPFSGNATDAILAWPKSVAVDLAGNVYIADYWDKVVRVVTLDGLIAPQVGSGTNNDPCTVQSPCTGYLNRFLRPEGLAVDPAGNLFISATDEYTGAYLAEDIPSDKDNDLFYFSSSGYDSRPTGTSLHPVAVDSSDSVFYTYSTRNSCFIMGQNKEYSRGSDSGAEIWVVAGSWRSGFSGDEGLASSAEIGGEIGAFAWDAAGNLYFTDWESGRVRRIDAVTGIIHSLAGSGGDHYSGDGGPATKAAGFWPNGVAVDSQGDVYFTSWDDRYRSFEAVRKVGGAGILTFDPRVLASPSPAQTILVSNVGNSVMKVLHMAFTSNDGGDFAIDPNTTTCDFPATPLQSGDTCRIGIIFTPSVLGARNAVLNMADNTAAGTHQIQLSGTGATPAQGQFSPPTRDFPQTQITTYSDTEIMTFQNTGGMPLSVTGYTLGPDFSFSFGSLNTCTFSGTMSPGEQCRMALYFYPLGAGHFTEQLVVHTSAGDVTATLTGTGATAGNPVLSSETIAFPTTAVQTSSPVQYVTLANTGGMPLAISRVVLSGDGRMHFAHASNSTCQAGNSIDAGGSCSIGFTFSPLATGTFSAQYVVTTYPGGDMTLTLTGTGALPAQPALAPTSITFPTTAINTTSASRAITLSNSGGMPFTINSVSLSGSGSDAFSSNPNQSCALTGSVAAGDSCQFFYTYSPKAVGTNSGLLKVTTSAGAVTAALSGTGVTAPKAVLSPATVAFPATGVGYASASQTLTLSNTGGMPFSIQSWALSGANPASYVPAGAASCYVTKMLEAGASCTISYSFNPAATGSTSATLTVLTDYDTVTATAAFSGTGVAPPKPTLSNNGTLAFPGTVVGTTSAAQSLTLTNTGGMPFTVSGWTTFGNNPGSFIYATTTCSLTTAMAPGASCTISFTFKPEALGQLLTQLAVDTNIQGLSATGTLTGTGIAQLPPTFSPTSLTFGPTAVGAKSAAQTLTLTNPGTAALTIQNATINGAQMSAFAATNTCGATLAAGAKCTFSVTFTPSPTAPGTQTAILAVSTSAGLATANLTGTTTATAALTPPTIDFGSQVSGTTSAAQTVTLTNAGGAALTITTAGKLAGTNPTAFGLTTTCGSSVAAGSNCTYSVTFKPTSITSFSATLTVATAAGTVSTALSGKGVASPKLRPGPPVVSRNAPMQSQGD